jgi:hypothetical protein
MSTGGQVFLISNEVDPLSPAQTSVLYSHSLFPTILFEGEVLLGSNLNANNSR